MNSLRKLDVVGGLVIAGIGLAFLISSLSITDMLGERLPPWMLPMSLSVCTMVSGLALAYKSRKSGGEDVLVQWPDRSGFLHLVVFVALTASYLVLIVVIGMPAATFLFTTATVWQLNRRPTQALLVGAGAAVIVHYCFAIGLEMNFPAGVFGS